MAPIRIMPMPRTLPGEGLMGEDQDIVKDDDKMQELSIRSACLPTRLSLIMAV